MKEMDRMASLFWLGIGAAVVVSSWVYGIGDFHKPGPGFLGFFAGSGLAVLSVVLLVSSSRKEPGKGGLRGLWSGAEVSKALYVVILLAAYMLAINPVGFLISTFVLLFLLFRVRGKYRLGTVVFVAFLVTAGSYVVFDLWLNVPLPRGILDFIL